MNANYPKLTIAIPTYNRAQPLLETLKALLPQITGEIELMILDNCSEVPCQDVYERAAAAISPHNRESIKIVRHPSNIGMQANILRCFELSNSPWIWILSDDDKPSVDGVSQALISTQDAASDTIAINFSSLLGPRATNFTTVGCNEFLQRMDHFGNFLFISANIYHVSSIKKQLRFGYTYSYSQAGFLAMLLLSIGTTGRISFQTASLVEFSPPSKSQQKWSSITLMLGISTLLELPLKASNTSFKLLEHNLMTMVLPPVELLKTIIFHPGNREFGAQRIFEQCFLRCYISGEIVRWPILKFILCRILIALPQSAQKQLISILSKKDDETINTDIGETRLERF